MVPNYERIFTPKEKGASWVAWFHWALFSELSSRTLCGCCWHVLIPGQCDVQGRSCFWGSPRIQPSQSAITSSSDPLKVRLITGKNKSVRHNIGGGGWRQTSASLWGWEGLGWHSRDGSLLRFCQQEARVCPFSLVWGVTTGISLLGLL